MKYMILVLSLFLTTNALALREGDPVKIISGAHSDKFGIITNKSDVGLAVRMPNGKNVPALLKYGQVRVISRNEYNSLFMTNYPLIWAERQAKDLANSDKAQNLWEKIKNAENTLEEMKREYEESKEAQEKADRSSLEIYKRRWSEASSDFEREYVFNEVLGQLYVCKSGD